MRRLFPAAVLTAAVWLLCGCGSWAPADAAGDGGALQSVGVDPALCTVNVVEDTHGGFHGDGSTFVTAACMDGVAAELAADGRWRALPLPEPLSQAIYGDDTHGSLLMDGAAGNVPAIENGYWFFCDRHAEHASAEDPTALWTRGSFNFTVALYDADTGALFYYALDT